jgi:hypothetical protein
MSSTQIDPSQIAQVTDDRVTANIGGVGVSVNTGMLVRVWHGMRGIHPGWWFTFLSASACVYIVERAFPYHMGIAVNRVTDSIDPRLERLDRNTERLGDFIGDLKDELKAQREADREQRRPIAVNPIGGGS